MYRNSSPSRSSFRPKYKLQGKGVHVVPVQLETGVRLKVNTGLQINPNEETVIHIEVDAGFQINAAEKTGHKTK